MNCAIHTDVPAAAFCRTCGKALCETCKREVKGVIFCEDCIATCVHENIPAAAPVPAQTVVVTSAPSPGLAGVLSGIFPFGIGQLYNRQYSKAVVYMLIFAFLVFAQSNADGLQPLPALVLGFFYLFQIFDAVRTAKAMQLAQPAPDTLGLNRFFGIQEEGATKSWTPSVPVGAIVLIGLGILFLLGNLGFIHLHRLGDWWPLILIGLGVAMFFRRQPVCTCVRCRAQYAMWPAVLVTVGVLSLLDTFGIRDFSSTWPILLVVIGLVKFLQASGPTTGHIDNSGAPGPPAPAEPPARPIPPEEPHNQEVTNA